MECNDIPILKHRCSDDKIVNENGNELLNMCVCNNLCIVNGRIGEYPVRTNASESENFPQAKGLMQGECLSPTLFACYINELEKKIN